MRRGFTFVEVLLGLLFIPLILMLSLSILQVMGGGLDNRITQEDVFLLQVEQYLIHANTVRFEGDSIVGTYLNEVFEMFHDRNRWVKRPGYEILLEGVSSVFREGDCMISVLSKRDICIEIP